MATYIVDSTGNNNAELIGDFVTDDVAHTVTFNSGTAGEAKPLKALETTRQWIVVEVREVGGVAGVIGKHVYSEDVTDIQTRVEAIRQDMIALHSTFIITCTHYKTEKVCDVYRGDEATVVALSAGDTNITFTPPGVWVIDDLTPFAPTTPQTSTNMVVDPGCDNAGEWTLNANLAITGSKLEATNSAGSRAYPNLTEVLEDGATYNVSVTCDAISSGYYRLYVGNTAWAYGFVGVSGTYSGTVTYTSSEPNSISIQASSSCTATFDDFTCERI